MQVICKSKTDTVFCPTDICRGNPSKIDEKSRVEIDLPPVFFSTQKKRGPTNSAGPLYSFPRRPGVFDPLTSSAPASVGRLLDRRC